MKLKITSRCKAEGKIYKPGDENNFKDDLATELLAKGLAASLQQPNKEKPSKGKLKEDMAE